MRDELKESLLAYAENHPKAVEATDPDKAGIALGLASQGYSRDKIHRETGLGEKTIDRLKNTHRAFLCESAAEQGCKAARIASMASRIAEQKLSMMDPREAKDEDDREARLKALSKTSAREISILYGVAIEKSVALNKDITAPEAAKSENTIDMVKGLMDELKQAKKPRKSASKKKTAKQKKTA